MTGVVIDSLSDRELKRRCNDAIDYLKAHPSDDSVREAIRRMLAAIEARGLTRPEIDPDALRDQHTR